jgi:Glycosyltransferase family 87
VENKHSERWLWFLIVVLFATAIGKFAVQDLPRLRATALKQNDVQQLYLGSRVWLQGQNPYSVDVLFSEMKQTNPAGAASLSGPCIVDCHLYYPPSALPVMALPALLSWNLFHAVYVAICILAYPIVLYRLSFLIEKLEYRWLFFSLGLAFSPYHAGLDTNNISALLIPLLLLATLCFDSAWSFALVGVIASTKPPLALILLFYYLLKRNKKALTVSVPIILAISAIGLFRLRSISWWPTYMKSIHDYSAGGGTLGVTDHGVLNFGFSNLQALFYVLFRSSHYAVVGNYVTLILLFAFFSWSVLRRPASEMSLNANILALSIVGCLTLFQSSLQYYNYTFLLSAGIFALNHRSNAVRTGLMAALCSFIFPPGLLLSLSRHTREPLSAAVQLAQTRGSWAGYQLSRGQELLVCIPSFVFLLITSYLIFAFQIKRKSVAI